MVYRTQTADRTGQRVDDRRYRVLHADPEKGDFFLKGNIEDPY